MSKVIVEMQVTLDGLIAGPNGELDWAMAEDEESRQDHFRLMESVDTLLMGRVMYPAYEHNWLAVLADPAGILPSSGRVASKNEIEYARIANKVQKLVFSKTLKKVKWETTRIVRDVE